MCKPCRYYISCPATRILAQPTTITGSIGVIGGKFNVAGGLNQVRHCAQTTMCIN